MAEKVKKKPGFFTLKRFNSAKSLREPPSPKSPSTPDIPDNPSYNPFRQTQPSPVVLRARNSLSENRSSKRVSNGGIRELVQCPLCLEVLHNPKMLPCQHTFCLACLIVYVADLHVIDCPICRTRVQVISSTFVNDLPSNLYIDSLLLLVKTNNKGGSSKESPAEPSPPSPKGMQSVVLLAGGKRCSQCKAMCDTSDVTSCDHCKQNFCRVCWSQHLDDMQTQISSILKQLDSAATRLEHKIENYKDRCERLSEHINMTAEEKLNAIVESKEQLLDEATKLQKKGELSALALKNSLNEAREVATKTMNVSEPFTKDSVRVTTFIHLHQNTLQILSEVSNWDTERFVFDKDNFTIEVDADTPYEAESDDPLPEAARQNNPLESEDSLALHYRTRNFIPHYVWRKTSRPCGVATSPWNNHLYICSMDTHNVLVVERTQAKIVARLANENMLCPAQVAFMKSKGEIYVTDKWKHCIHVFSMEGEYLRCIGQKGSRLGMFRSPEGIATDNSNNLIYVVDTGNDRVQVLQPDGKPVDQIGVVVKQQPTNTSSVWQTKDTSCTELNAPTSVALTNDRVIVLDSGNRRVKIYNKKDKNKILEFGSLGQRKGQFRQPEVLTVDPMGFILVGDSGNSRVQVFKPTGQLVRVFGGLGSVPGKFGWISGIHVTKQLDIIISDTKNHNVNFI